MALGGRLTAGYIHCTALHSCLVGVLRSCRLKLTIAGRPTAVRQVDLHRLVHLASSMSRSLQGLGILAVPCR